MATLGTQALTLSDLRNRLAPDGSVDFIIESLLNANPIMDDITWKMGNLPTGNRTTIRTSMPKPSVRRINRGVTRHKSTTKQVQDTCIILEDRSCVDVEEIALAPNGEQFRRSEDAAFVGGFSDAIAANIFYGNADDDLDTFNGLSMRYPIVGGEKNTAGYQDCECGCKEHLGIPGWLGHACNERYLPEELEGRSHTARPWRTDRNRPRRKGVSGTRHTL